MTFADLLAGDPVFVDANTLVYHFQPHPVLGSVCSALIKRLELREVAGFTSSHVVAEVAHRLMTLEAMKRFGWPAPGIVPRLRKHPGEVQKLTDFRQAIEKIPLLHFRILDVTQAFIEKATEISQQTGLLTNDAVIVAVMRAHGLTKLASHDADFDRVPGLTRYAPV
jgi:predicted nucleic acid-binding protein